MGLAAEKLATGEDRPVLERPRDQDELLLEQIAGGSERAFRQLVERHIDPAYALALRILRSHTDAEDVVQDVLLKIWTHGAAWQAGRAKFSTWLFKVVTNRCLDLYRKPKPVDLDTAPEMPDSSPDAVTALHTSELSGLLEDAMAKLPEHQRLALILSYHDDLSNAEIAEIMDTTIPAVESLLKRGRQQLRKMLSSLEGEIRESFTKT